MEKVRLGKTEMMVSKLAFGGIPIQRCPGDEAVSVVRRCIEKGVTYFDTANGYTNSEGDIGKAIVGCRKDLILASKTRGRNRKEVENHLKLSLERLGVDYIDLYQFHDVSKFETLEQILAPNGPLDTLKDAKKAGKIRHIGVTCHSMDVAKEAVKSDRFETIMFPFNFITCEPADELLPLAKKHDVGFLAMKPLNGGVIENVTIAFKYLLKFPDIVPVVGIEKTREIDEIVNILEGSRKITRAEQKEMQRLKDELGTRFCRRCDYCQPCTEEIPISTVLGVPALFKRVPPEVAFSPMFSAPMDKATNCAKCGNCEARCPFGLPIMEMIEKNSNFYQAEKKKYLKAKAK
ncbi:MAG: aldo/keto reductase [Chloroflexota bacterium]